MHSQNTPTAPRPPRAKVFQVATLMVGGADIRVHMLDVSTVGARIHGAGAFEVGAQVMLAWAGEGHLARIAWSRGGMAGVRFLFPLSKQRMESLFESA